MERHTRVTLAVLLVYLIAAGLILGLMIVYPLIAKE